MFSHQLYNLVHIVGLVFLMAGLGGMTLSAATATAGEVRWTRRLAIAFHAVGIFLVLLGGFGMLARLGIVQGSSWPGWVWVKMGVWIVLGAAAFLPYRFPRTARPVLLLLPVLGGLAAYMAIYKPL
ncbi:MAG: hypothetical protein WD766_14610 [Gemmatimonadota bacterium]